MADTGKKKSGTARKGGARRRTARKPAGAAAEAKAKLATAVDQEEVKGRTEKSDANVRTRRTARKSTGAAAEAKAELAASVDLEEANGDTGSGTRDSGENGKDQIHTKVKDSETLVELALSVPQFRSRIISHLLRKLR